MSAPEPDRVAAVAAEVRAFLEPRWRAWNAERRPWMLEPGAPPLSHGMCRFSALFLARALEAEIGGEWLVDGGCGEPPGRADPRDVDTRRSPGGMADPDGRWHGHYWVVDGEWSVIADVTGDQFGWEPVLVADTEDSRFRANYREAAIEEHLEHVAGRIEGWLEEWVAERRAAVAPP